MPSAKKPTEQVNITTLPNSVEAEQNVLCCIMRDESHQLDIIAKLQPDDFYQHNHTLIFEAMQSVSVARHKVDNEEHVNTVNFATVVDCLRRNGKLQQVGDIDYIMKLNDMLPSTAKAEEYVAIVKRASTMRKLIQICGEITQKAYSSESEEQAIHFAEEKIFNLSQRGSNGGLTDLSSQVAETIVKINDRYLNPKKFQGIATGFDRFDRMTNGLHGGELIVLAARPGVGKSAMAMNIVEHVAKQGKTVAIFSLEMSNEQLIERLLSSMSGIPLGDLKSGNLTGGENDIIKLQTVHNIIAENMSLFGNDYANIKPSEINSQCRRLKATKGLDMVVIDYIQLMNNTDLDIKDRSRQNEVASITRALKLMAKELNVPVLALSQLKREAEIRNIAGRDKNSVGASEPVLSDLRESGAIEQDADIVLFIHRENTEDRNSEDVKLIVAKHRNGETGSIDLTWVGNLVRFVNKRNVSVVSKAQTEEEQQMPEEDLNDVQPEEPTDMNEESQEDFVMDDTIE